MDDDEDDFYGGGGSGAQEVEYTTEAQESEQAGEQMDMSEDEDSDDDIKFTLEKKPEDAKPETISSKPTRQETTSQEPSESKPARITSPKQDQRPSSTAPASAVRGTLTHDGKEGKDFPDIRTSKLDINGTPTWPASGKPITEVDLDADLAENSKLWRLPGTDVTDFFNYGFDEYTWAQYCVRQQSMANTITEQKQADAQLKAMFGGAGPPGAGGGPPGMPPSMPAGMAGGGGLPNPDEMMQQMLNAGLDPTNSSQFFQFVQSMGMPGGPGPPNPQQGGGMGYGQQGGFAGANSASPHPQPGQGQGFQPPQGPAAQIQQGDGGFQGNMDGYSAQQMAIMQQQQGGGRRGGRGRGRW